MYARMFFNYFRAVFYTNFSRCKTFVKHFSQFIPKYPIIGIFLSSQI